MHTSLHIMKKPFELAFSNGLIGNAIWVELTEELPHALRSLGLECPSPVLVLVGGADGLGDSEMASLRPVFVRVLAPLAEALGVSVVDGGTDAGVMRLMGAARAEVGAGFPLIGVAAADTVTLPNASSTSFDAAPLEPHHTHFVLVPGSSWGDEAPWLASVANALGYGAPSVTVLVDGGETTWEDATLSIEAGRPVIVVAGTGRAADAIASAVTSSEGEGQGQELAASGLVRVATPGSGSEGLVDMLKTSLSGRG